MLFLANQEYDAKFISYLDHEYNLLKNNGKWGLILKRILASWSAQIICEENLNTEFLFFKSMFRKDYDDFYSQVKLSCVSQKKSIELKYKYSLKGLLSSFIVLRQLKVNRFSYFHLVKSVFIYSNLIKCSKLVFKAQKWSCKVLVVFGDMQPEDNMITQFFRKNKNTITCTLQHGLYVDYSSSPNINEVNYNNTVAEYFLAWGQETSNLIRKYHKNKSIKICGKPIELGPSNTPKEDIFTVILDQKIFSKYNRQLIEIAFEAAEILNFKVNIKLHPLDNIENYDLDDNYIISEGSIATSQFILAHTTTLMYELMRSGYNVYKYETEIPCNETNKKITFKTCHELVKIIHKPYDQKGDFYIKYVGKESREKYKQFFSSLI
ncbi:MAG: hypothetical protein AAF693_07450 [Bacteroidota bacterium]